MPFDGVPMNYSFNKPNAKDTRNVQYYELFGNRAIYADGWTAVTLHRGKRPWVLNATGSIEDDKWELYNLKEDIGERNDRAHTDSLKRKELILALESWWDNNKAPIPTQRNPLYIEP